MTRSTFRNLLALVLLSAVFFLVLSPVLASESIYKWVDDDGVTHFSAQPPEGVDYRRIDTRSGLSEVPAQIEDEALPEEAAAEGPATEPVPAQPEVTVGEPDPELVAERCEQARSNIVWLTERRRVTVRDDDGQETVLDDNERLQMIEDTEQFIAEWC